MTGKTALRAVRQAEITLDRVRAPVENEPANCRSLEDVPQVPGRTRYPVAWRALGWATASYALAHALRREQFGSRSQCAGWCRTSWRGCRPGSRRCS